MSFPKKCCFFECSSCSEMKCVRIFCLCVCVRMDIPVCMCDRGTSDNDMSRLCPLSVERIKLIFILKECHQNMCPVNSSIEEHASQ